MLNRFSSTLGALFILSLLSACSGTDYQPAAAQSEPVDLRDYAPRVDNFVVLLDTSGSMAGETSSSTKAQQAQDMVANFNAAVPEAGFTAGLIIFGKGAGSCLGDGVATKIYGMETYSTQGFQNALEGVGCVRSTTPIVSAMDIAAGALPKNAGDTAVIVFSDFKWSDFEGVKTALSTLASAQADRVCVHAVHIGDESGNTDRIAELGAVNECGSSVRASDIAAADAMTNYAASVLMAPVAYEKFTLSAMTLFDFDKADLKPRGRIELQRLRDHIRSQGIRVRDIDIIGHTDSIGSQVYNAGLSERRAQAVEAYLVAEGVDPTLIEIAGMGELDPVSSNKSPNGRAMNRRVEVLVGAASPAGN